MPSLPLPPGVTQLGGALPFSSTDDVLAILPAFLKPTDSAPVRDAIVAAILAMALVYQERSGYAAAQSDVLRAVDTYLAGQGADRGVVQQTGESSTAYRARILSTPNLVTPTAILAAVNSLLAPVTTIKAQYCESVQDRWYVRKNGSSSGLSTFHSFVYKSTAVRSRSPYYLDRLYEDDAAQNGGVFRAQSNPGGARVWNDTLGRFFLLRIPDITPIDSGGAFGFKTAETVYPVGSKQPGLGMFAFKHASAGSAYGAYARADATSSATIYSAIVNVVGRLHAASIRWAVLVDPKLT